MIRPIEEFLVADKCFLLAASLVDILKFEVYFACVWRTEE